MAGHLAGHGSGPSRRAARFREPPLLAGNPEDRLASLLEERQPIYQLADAAVDVDALSPDHVAAEVVRLWYEHRASSAQPHPGRDIYYQPQGRLAATVRTQTAVYPIVVESGALDAVGEVCQEEGLSGRAFVIADTAVASTYGEQLLASLRGAGYRPEVLSLPGGESEKTLDTVSGVYDWLIEQRAERTDFAICFGGGVITDLAGFAAATYLRGIPFVHVPTTLLGMVDAAIGGKTGVDHRRGNLVGAFAQPAAVVIDPDVLHTLPDRELRAGWAEVIKHGLILDRTLFDELAAVAGDPSAMVDPRLIGWSTAIKASVVSRDERESDTRALLNYGHTLGHAIESVTGYTTYLHGEAVAIGMRAAGLIAVELGLLPEGEFQRQQEAIERCGLPTSASGVSPDAVLDATLRDKKVRGGKLNWVLLEGIGHATTRNDVPPELVERVTRTVLEA
ncbi:MAG: 3-dehydroquinate synthase [Dehalococcoidia bacterium]|nr:3-dehydroquinate synthase [Dehalococcoidia bacterium]